MSDSRPTSAASESAFSAARAAHAEARLAEAEAALARSPGDPACLYNLGNAMRELSRLDEALALYLEAARVDPRLVFAHYNAANLFKQSGRLAEAEAAYRSAIAVTPDHVEAHNNLGATLADAGRLDEAAACYREAIRLRPTHALAYNNLGNLLRETGAHEEAEKLYRQALALRSDLAEVWGHHANSLLDLGRLEEAEIDYRRALELSPGLAGTRSNLLLLLNYRTGLAPAALRAEAESYGRVVDAPARARTPRAPRTGRRLRVGYVSGDFRLHSVAFFFAPVLEHHDRTRYEITCYQCSPRSDAMTEALRKRSEHWREAWRLDDVALDSVIRDDGIDILVDLSGHTAENRLPVFARRPAPLQATWLGYPGTTGVAEIDFRITDAVVDPPGASDAAYTEHLYRLPRPMWCFRPDPRMPDVGPLPARNRPPTFGSFNYFPKLNDCVLVVWAGVLREVPNSRLVITRVPGPDSARRLTSKFAGLGVDPRRLDLHGVLDRDRLASVIAGVDIALDPFPYAGTTTTCEALWMGLPVVSLAGVTTAARSGASLLSAVGLTDCVADSVDAYAAIARRLALDLEGLTRIRATLRSRFAASLLRDDIGFTRDLELAYETMWDSD